MVVKNIDLWPMHEKLLWIDDGGISFLSKFYFNGNVMAQLLLQIFAFFNSSKKKILSTN